MEYGRYIDSYAYFNQKISPQTVRLGQKSYQTDVDFAARDREISENSKVLHQEIIDEIKEIVLHRMVNVVE